VGKIVRVSGNLILLNLNRIVAHLPLGSVYKLKGKWAPLFIPGISHIRRVSEALGEKCRVVSCRVAQLNFGRLLQPQTLGPCTFCLVKHVHGVEVSIPSTYSRDNQV